MYHHPAITVSWNCLQVNLQWHGTCRCPQVYLQWHGTCSCLAETSEIIFPPEAEVFFPGINHYFPWPRYACGSGGLFWLWNPLSFPFTYLGQLLTDPGLEMVKMAGRGGWESLQMYFWQNDRAHIKDPGHSAKSTGGRLELTTHVPCICGFQQN